MFLFPKSMADTGTDLVSIPSSAPYSLDHKIVFYIQIYKDMDGSKPDFIAIWTPKNEHFKMQRILAAAY